MPIKVLRDGQDETAMVTIAVDTTVQAGQTHPDCAIGDANF
jgi:hypothetical protein